MSFKSSILSAAAAMLAAAFNGESTASVVFKHEKTPSHKGNLKKCKSCEYFFKGSKYTCYCHLKNNSVAPMQIACDQYTKKKRK